MSRVIHARVIIVGLPDESLVHGRNASLKGRVHCFSMQVVMKKCFLLNPGKTFDANSSYHFREKRTLNSKK